jgi:hypothetical protein
MESDSALFIQENIHGRRKKIIPLARCQSNRVHDAPGPLLMYAERVKILFESG